MLNLDTHILLHALSDDLTATERRVLRGDQWSISAIVLWEIAKLAELARVELDLDDADVVRAFTSVRVWPITLDIAKQSTRLDIDGDPADQVICATSLVHNLPLITRDRALRRSKLVPLVR